MSERLEQKITIQMAKNQIKTKKELAEKMDITIMGIDKIFKRNDCKLSFLLKMCDIMNCTLHDLTGR